ncbi:MAG: hypothetical protein WAM90_16585 [Rhodanobacter sp.]
MASECKSNSDPTKAMEFTVHRFEPFRCLLLVSSLALFFAPAAIAETTVTSDQLARDTQDVPHVMDAFHDAVLSHDAPKIEALFVTEGSAWNTVLTEQAYAEMKKKSPAVQKVRAGSYRDFMKFVSNTKQTLEPKRSHVTIHQDGSLASVYFDYVFLVNGKIENSGHEAWQLVKGANGWRIAAIAYSSNPPIE